MAETAVRAAVLIIGSLWWEDDLRSKGDRVRIAWRETYLDNYKETVQRVNVPIGYGRYSGSARRRHYTMIFANAQARAKMGPGVGLVAPCRASYDVDRHISELAIAEGINAGSDWGAVALLANPPRAAALNTVLSKWRQSFARRAGVNPRTPDLEKDFAVTAAGRLDIPWPKLAGTATDLDFDLLLATANKATLVNGAYATPATIAERFATAGEAGAGDPRYFVENVRAGIRTADDAAIWQAMINKKPAWKQQHPDIEALLAAP